MHSRVCAAAWNLLGKFDEVIADINEAIKLDPEFPNHFLLRGGAWLGKHDYDKAAADLTEAIRLDPKDAYAYSQRRCVGQEVRARKGDRRPHDGDPARPDGSLLSCETCQLLVSPGNSRQGHRGLCRSHAHRAE